MMNTLNKGASEAMVQAGVNACTDVTGFSLLGHLYEMVRAGDVGAVVKMNDVPILSGTADLVRQGIAPGGTTRNLEYLERFIGWPHGIEDWERFILCDPQTSGGLLISVPREKGEKLLSVLNGEKGLHAAIIGEIVDADKYENPMTVI
jgi:selenide,water dikinase